MTSIMIQHQNPWSFILWQLNQTILCQAMSICVFNKFSNSLAIYKMRWTVSIILPYHRFITKSTSFWKYFHINNNKWHAKSIILPLLFFFVKTSYLVYTTLNSNQCTTPILRYTQEPCFSIMCFNRSREPTTARIATANGSAVFCRTMFIVSASQSMPHWFITI